MVITRLVLRILLLDLAGWITAPLQSAERSPKMPALSEKSKPLVDTDGGVWDGHEDEKCSAASQLQLINWENKQRLQELKKVATMVEEVPEMLTDISTDDFNYLYFLAHKLELYTEIDAQNNKLEQICREAIKDKSNLKLPGVSLELRAEFIKNHGRPLLKLYDNVVLAHDVTKLKKVLKKQLVPDMDILRTEWENKQFLVAADFVEIVVTMPVSKISAQWTNLGVVRPVPSRACRFFEFYDDR